MEYILLLVGFILLIKGADFSWRKFSLAGILKVPSGSIGLTIAAMGTSAPEASCQHQCCPRWQYDIAISNVVGLEYLQRAGGRYLRIPAQLYAPRRDPEAGYAVKYPGNRRIMSDVFRWQIKPH